MKINPKQFVITLSTFIGVIYVICAILITLAPVTSMKVANLIFHGMDLTKIPKEISFPDIIYGFIVSIISTIIFSMIFVYLWNYFDQKYGGK
ncbi:hypothetical protein J4471_02580 [Candidatus Woesearchaeota archaeon]|nr:hypothetical protein [Candidatus Woesearchaeota archaeon]